MSFKATNEGLEKAIASLRSKNRSVEKERDTWRFIATSDEFEMRSNESKEKIVGLVCEYSGDHYDYLEPLSKIYTAIAWSIYPSQSFNILVNEVAEFSPELSDMIKADGIIFYVIAKGDRFRNTGMINEEFDLATDTEGWYEEIPGFKAWQDENEDLEAPSKALWDAIATFGMNVVEEVEAYLKKLS